MSCDGVSHMRVSNALENPPINPITGHGRTAADVRREKDAYQQSAREAAVASEGEAAIFQGDFIFVKLQHKGVQLHRVANGLCIQDATDVQLSFTTAEYAHTPQDGVEGFWGYFEPALNPSYDPEDKKSGTMFARHHNIGRDVILVYDVQVYKVWGVLSLSISLTISHLCALWSVQVLLVKIRKDRDNPAERDRTVIRVSAESLRRLAAKLPNEFPLPDEIPETHASRASEARSRRWWGRPSSCPP